MHVYEPNNKFLNFVEGELLGTDNLDDLLSASSFFVKNFLLNSKIIRDDRLIT